MHLKLPYNVLHSSGMTRLRLLKKVSSGTLPWCMAANILSRDAWHLSIRSVV